jgi:hypothetical protein
MVLHHSSKARRVSALARRIDSSICGNSVSVGTSSLITTFPAPDAVIGKAATRLRTNRRPYWRAARLNLRNSQRANSISRVVGSRARRANSLAAKYSFSVAALGICSRYRLICMASSGCPSRRSVSHTASHARRTSSRVRSSFSLPGSIWSLPSFNSRNTASTRFRIWVDSPRLLARKMPSDLRGIDSPRMCRGVAFAATPNARR